MADNQQEGNVQVAVLSLTNCRESLSTVRSDCRKLHLHKQVSRKGGCDLLTGRWTESFNILQSTQRHPSVTHWKILAESKRRIYWNNTVDQTGEYADIHHFTGNDLSKTLGMLVFGNKTGNNRCSLLDAKTYKESEYSSPIITTSNEHLKAKKKQLDSILNQLFFLYFWPFSDWLQNLPNISYGYAWEFFAENILLYFQQALSPSFSRAS